MRHPEVRTASRRREQTGWYFYDFANSAFASTVVTLLFGPYIVNIAKAAAGPDGMVQPLGIPVDPRSWYSYLVAISVMLQVVVLPMVGAHGGCEPAQEAVADRLGLPGRFRDRGDVLHHRRSAYLSGGLLFMLANVAFGASIVVYNSFLPDIATPRSGIRCPRRAGDSATWAEGWRSASTCALREGGGPRPDGGDGGAHQSRIGRLLVGGVHHLPLFTLRNRPVSARRSAAR